MKNLYKNLGLIILSFISFTSFGQIIASQSFESSGDTWSSTFSTPACNTGSDIWDYQTSLSSITPSDGSQFWGIRDLQGDCGGSDFETITLSNISISGCSSVSFSFDYYTIGFDDGDDIKYELFYDGVSQGEVIVVDGNSNFSTSGWATETISIPGTVSTVSVIISVKQNGGSDYAGIDNIVLTGSCASCTGPTTEPTQPATSLSATPSCTTVDLSWTAGSDASNSLVVISTSAITGSPTDGTAYTAGIFGSADELNTGEYVVYTGTGNSTTVSGLSEGTTYFVSVISYNSGTLSDCEENYLNSVTSTSFTTSTGCVTSTSSIQSILYNSCNGSNEGLDEIVTFTVGPSDINVDDIIIYYPNVTYCNTCSGYSGTVSGTNLNNATYVAQLNALAGCTVFVYSSIIPAGATVMVFTGNPPSTVLDYSSQCGASNLPVYVIFNDNTSTTGRFSNSAVRDLTIDFGDGTTQTVTYDGSNGVVSGDGSTAVFDEYGNVSYISSNNCVFPLPVELYSLSAQANDSYNHIEWVTLSEVNNDYFEVQKSTNGEDFYSIGTVLGAGNSSETNTYEFLDRNVTSDITYYRLKQVDYDGEFEYSHSVKVQNTNVYTYYSDEQIHFNFSHTPSDENYTVNIYNVSGQLIKTVQIQGNQSIDWTENGIYIIEIKELNAQYKIPCIR